MHTVQLLLEDAGGREFGGEFSVNDIKCQDGWVSVNVKYAGPTEGKTINEASIRLQYSVVSSMVAAAIRELNRLDICVSDLLEDGMSVHLGHSRP